MSAWYPNERDSYRDFLQKEFRFLANEIENGARSVGKDISTEIGNNIYDVKDTMYDLQTQVSQFNKDFNRAMGLLINQFVHQEDLINGLIQKVDKVQRVIESPVLTQAREYYRLGVEKMRRKLFVEAMDFFQKAAEKNSADYFTQSGLGTLYLYGVTADDNLIDPKEAERHFLLAARYAKAESELDAKFIQLEAESLFHASFAIFAQLGDEELRKDEKQYKQELMKGRELAERACEKYPEGVYLDAEYQVARYSALLDDPKTAISALKKAIVTDRDYKILAERDPVFEPIREVVTATITNFRKSRKKESIHLLELLKVFRDWIPQFQLAFSHRGDDEIIDFENEISSAERLIENDNYFGFLDAIGILEGLLSQVPEIVAEKFDKMWSKILQEISHIENELVPKEYIFTEDIRLNLTEIDRLISESHDHLKSAKGFLSVHDELEGYLTNLRSCPKLLERNSQHQTRSIFEITEVDDRFEYLLSIDSVKEYLDQFIVKRFIPTNDAADCVERAKVNALKAKSDSESIESLEKELRQIYIKSQVISKWSYLSTPKAYKLIEKYFARMYDIHELLDKKDYDSLLKASSISDTARIILEQADTSRVLELENLKKIGEEKDFIKKWAIVGAIVGIIAGGFISFFAKSADTSPAFAFMNGVFYGGFGGLLIGAISSLLVSKVLKVK